MAIMNKTEFAKWTKKHDWILCNNTPITTGRQMMFMTPAGNLTIAMCDLKGDLESFGMVVPPPAMAMSQLQFDPRGGPQLRKP